MNPEPFNRSDISYKETEMTNENEEKAIDIKVTLADGSESLLSDLWKKQTLVLVFLRHLG
jgi:hypothetical protein